MIKKIFSALLICSLSCVLCIGEDITVEKWKILGPFLSGPRQFDIDYLLDYGGEEKIIPNPDQKFYSIQPNGGKIHWFSLKSSSPNVKVSYPGVDWEFLISLFGQHAAELSNNGYAYTEIDFKQKTKALILVKTVHTFWINGIRHDGEYYTHSYNGTPVIFKKGKNRILLKFHAHANANFYFLIRTIDEDIHMLKDFTTPDIVRGKLMKKSFTGVPVVNMTQKWLRDLRAVIVQDEYFSQTKTNIPPIAPLSVMKFPVPLSQSKIFSEDIQSHDLKLKIMRANKEIGSETLSLRIKNINNPYRLTYVSQADKSVQYYSIRYPRHYSLSKKYALLLSLHGGGDEGQIMAEAHDSKDWAFVVGPTNRRPRGFAWHDLGRIDLFEVIADMEKRFSIDRDRILLTGASMGGQGSWYNGLMYPSTFAAIAPEAGYSSREIYSPFYLQKGIIFAHPGIKSIIDRLYLDTHLPYFLENVSHLPVIVTHGGADHVVPPIHPRIMQSGMRDLGYSFQYREFPGKPHFWYERRFEEGEGRLWGVCIDHPEILSFLEKQRKVVYPKEVKFRLIDLSVNNKYYWITVTEQMKTFYPTRVEAKVEQDSLFIKTKNVRKMKLHLPPELVTGTKIKTTWNREIFQLDIPENRIVVLGKGSSYSLKKTPELYGPLKNVFFKPFILVYGTKGSAQETSVLLNNARFFAHRVWRWANGMTRIIPDQEVTDEIIQTYNLILFGSPERNFVTAQISEDLPIHLEKGKILFDRKVLDDDEFTMAMVYPNPFNPDKLLAVYAGTTLEMEQLSTKILPISRNFALPDFIIAGKNFDRWGWAGVKAAGFFSPQWNLSNRDYFLEYE